MISYLFFSLLTLLVCAQNDQTKEDAQSQYPTVMVALLLRNKEHTLPYFLHYFQQIDYPKYRIALWIRADHNVDSSVTILDTWLPRIQGLYHWVDYQKDDEGKGYSDEIGPCDWSRKRFENVIRLRQQALNRAREVWADYLLFTDVDNFLKNDQVLKDLINQKKTIVSPMLNATASDHYSNFWGDMDERGYYKRSDDYKSIQLRHKEGCLPVAVVHSTMLIDLNAQESKQLAFYPAPPDYKGPLDDIILFASSAKHHGVTMYILNTDFYGYMLIPMDAENTLLHEKQQFLHCKVENIIYHTPLEKLPYIDVPTIQEYSFGFDQIYVINLDRRPDRREKMELCLKELGIKAKFVSAVDGKKLNDTYLNKLGVKQLPEFADPYKGRAMTMGEIGCFLSHFFIWEDMVQHNYSQILIFEDDIRFELYFRESLAHVMHQMNTLHLHWDLVYLGRKRLNHDSEAHLDATDRLLWPDYSYWTLSYMLNLRGARKLLDQQPLARMVPVDEYLPIMFDRHPEESWKRPFSPRNLIAMSFSPLLVYPTHYTGEHGYITDTEDSEIIADQLKGGPNEDVKSSTFPATGHQDCRIPEPDPNSVLAKAGSAGGWDEL